MKSIVLSILAIGLAGNLATAKDEFYAEPPLFHFFPDPNASTNTIGRVGPIGLALELRKPAFTMHISSVEEGSPAAATGKLKKGQIIASINGDRRFPHQARTGLEVALVRDEAQAGRDARALSRQTPTHPGLPARCGALTKKRFPFSRSGR